MSEARSTQTRQPLLRKAVAAFADASSLEQAIVELKHAGMEREQLGLLAKRDSIDTKLEHLYVEVAWDPSCEQCPEYQYVEKTNAKMPVTAIFGGLGLVATAAAGGALVASAAVLAGPIGAVTAGATTVGGIGALASTMIAETDAQRLQSELEEGHLLLFIDAKDGAEEGQALVIMEKAGGINADTVEFRGEAA